MQLSILISSEIMLQAGDFVWICTRLSWKRKVNFFTFSNSQSENCICDGVYQTTKQHIFFSNILFMLVYLMLMSLEKYACDDISAKWYCIACCTFRDTFKVKHPVSGTKRCSVLSETDEQQMNWQHCIILVVICNTAVQKWNVWWVALKVGLKIMYSLH